MALQTVSVILIEPVNVFEFGVAVEVFGLDRTDDGVPALDFRVCSVNPGVPMQTKNISPFAITPTHSLDEVADSDLLMSICRRLTAPDPLLRYATAEDANTGGEGLAEFQRTLVIGDLASEYDNELRVWLEELD